MILLIFSNGKSSGFLCNIKILRQIFCPLPPFSLIFLDSLWNFVQSWLLFWRFLGICLFAKQVKYSCIQCLNGHKRALSCHLTICLVRSVLSNKQKRSLFVEKGMLKLNNHSAVFNFRTVEFNFRMRELNNKSAESNTYCIFICCYLHNDWLYRYI